MASLDLHDKIVNWVKISAQVDSLEKLEETMLFVMKALP